MRVRARTAGIHLALSLLVATVAALLVFGLWYPYPYREVSGGRDLFLLVVTVDIVIGPMITFAVFNMSKPPTELRRDLAIVGLLQLAALAYGLWTVHMAKPVHMVFEYDRFRVVHQLDLPADADERAPEGIAVAPWGGPTVIALRPFRSEDEKLDMTVKALGGTSLSARPELWHPYATERKEVVLAARPIDALLKRFPARAAQIEAAVRKTGRPVDRVRFLPLLARRDMAWTVLLDASTGDILDYLPLDPY